MRILVITALVVGWAFSTPSGFGGTVSITSGPSVQLTGNLVDTTASGPPPVLPLGAEIYTFNGQPAAKVYGNLTFTDSDGGGGTVTIMLEGNASASVGDFASLGYSFSITASGGTVTPTVGVSGQFTPVFPPISIPFDESAVLPSAGTGTSLYNGFIATDPSPVAANGTYSARAVFDWIGAAMNDTLTIYIPNSSIDLAVNTIAVPEPVTLTFLPLGFALLAARRPRRTA